jgi:HJR/Mrr/RecB family endonuclease
LGNTPVQEVYAGKTFYRCHVGVVMTNSTFTKGAVELADSVGVILWDKDRLDKMMVKTGMQEFTKNKDT